MRTLTPSRDLLLKSIELVVRNPIPLLTLTLVPSLLLQAATLATHANLHTQIVITLVGVAISCINAPVLAYCSVQLARGRDVGLAEAYRKGLRYFGRVWWYQITTSVLIVGGLLFFIIPGCIMWRRFALGQYYIVDQNMGVNEAMEHSSHASTPAAGYIWGTLGIELAYFIVIVLASYPISRVSPEGASLLVGLCLTGITCLLPLRYVEIAKRAVS